MSCNLEEEELLFRGTFAPSNFRPCVTFVPRDRTFEELLHPETFVPVELAFLENKYCKNLRSKRQKKFQNFDDKCHTCNYWPHALVLSNYNICRHCDACAKLLSTGN